MANPNRITSGGKLSGYNRISNIPGLSYGDDQMPSGPRTRRPGQKVRGLGRDILERANRCSWYEEMKENHQRSKKVATPGENKSLSPMKEYMRIGATPSEDNLKKEDKEPAETADEELVGCQPKLEIADSESETSSYQENTDDELIGCQCSQKIGKIDTVSKKGPQPIRENHEPVRVNEVTPSMEVETWTPDDVDGVDVDWDVNNGYDEDSDYSEGLNEEILSRPDEQQEYKQKNRRRLKGDLAKQYARMQEGSIKPLIFNHPS